MQKKKQKKKERKKNNNNKNNKKTTTMVRKCLTGLRLPPKLEDTGPYFSLYHSKNDNLDPDDKYFLLW
jgi:hypothetical protein